MSKTAEMVKVKLLSSRAGHRFNGKGQCIGSFAQAVNDIVEMDSDEAQRNIDAGLAILAPASIEAKK